MEVCFISVEKPPTSFHHNTGYIERFITMNTVKHPIPPVFDSSSRILILGSFPSVKSREGHFFYHHPQNRFWKTLAGVLKSPVPISIDEKKEFLATLGVSTSGLDRLIAASYKLLGLISYLTAGPTESRAWTITKGTKAPGAAGKIHSDFEKGFIRAEVVSYDDLMRLGSYNAAREQGLVRSEGKEYVVKDGDVILFRFNV